MAKLTLDFHTKSLARKTRLDLFFPSLNLGGCLRNQDVNYYQNNEQKYPLIICLHGFGDDLTSWQNNSAFLKLCEDNKIAACFVNGENSFYHNLGPINNYYSLIEEEIIDFLYGNFRCLSPDMPLAIAGVSMGGYGALYHYLKNTDKYACGIALSPAIRPDRLDESKFGTLKDLFLENKDKKLNCYISIGENDFIIEASKKLNQFLLDNKIDASYKFIKDRDHSWPLWREEMIYIFDYLKKSGLIG